MSVFIHRDKSQITKEHSGYGFVEFQSEADVDYACKIMNGIMLFNQPIRVSRSGRDRKQFDIGANLFIGNLDPEVDERHLTETFQHFGTLISPPKISRDETSGTSKGFAFILYDSFEAADAAIAAMDGHFFGGKRISVNFAYKKDKPGERHGDQAERMLAAKNPMAKVRKEVASVAPGLAAPPPNIGAPPPFSMPAPHAAAPGMMPQVAYQAPMGVPFGSPPPFAMGPAPGMGAPPPFGYPPQQAPPHMPRAYAPAPYGQPPYGQPFGSPYSQPPNNYPR